MRAILFREYYDKQTCGTLTVYDEDTGEEVFKCRTLELPDRDNQRNVSCIPEGFYDVVPRTSPKYSNHFIVKDVPNRTYILFHPANFVGSVNPRTGSPDLRGCIAVGKKFGDITNDGIPELLQSKAAMKELLKAAPNGFVLEITQ